jgi:hypothetical protein
MEKQCDHTLITDGWTEGSPAMIDVCADLERRHPDIDHRFRIGTPA